MDGEHVPRGNAPSVTEVSLRIGQAPPFASAGHYQVVDEVGRGGIGVVLRGRDMDLGRDVALKVLRERHLANRDVVERFVEEAQIGGQLQHPGIVPVYELGIEGEKRPFFAMKLVQGETLESVLASRENVGSDRRRVLSILLRVCQAVAYAHSRGVVHRDLKPSNVMVGRYGEVQVLDWGLAKVLGRERASASVLSDEVEAPVSTARTGSRDSSSRAGEVMGTFAYMPPEQARGRVDEVDARSDVFALGAILCEVLTGVPPYGGHKGETIDRARRGLTEEALERLDACDAETELVTWVRACLSSARGDRPRHAGVLAEALSRHLSDVADRARRAELAAVERRGEADRSRIRAEEARAAAAALRRRRRQTLLIAGGVALLLVVAGAGWLRLSQGRAARAGRAAASVEELLREAGRRAGRGELTAAVAAAERAWELGATDPVPRPTRQRARSQLAALRLEARRAAEEVALVARLEEVRTRPEGGDVPAALREHGIDPERLGTRGAASEEVVGALDEAGLFAITRTADPDALRNRIRSADLDELRSFAMEADDAELPIRTLDLLALRLLAAGAHVEAAALLRGAWLRHPGDLWSHVHLAESLSRAEGGEAEAARHWAAAAALRPRCVGIGRRLVAVHRALGDEESASRAARTLAMTLYGAGRDAEAVEAFALAKTDGTARDAFVLAKAHARLGHEREARSAFASGCEWLEENDVRSAETERLRDEAEAALGVGGGG